MNNQQFFNSLKYLSLKPYVEHGRIKFSGNSSLNEVYKALDELPGVEGELILRLAVHNPELLERIQERACIRWAEGLSDSLQSAVMSNIRSSAEKAKRDEKGQIILRPITDWKAELRKYETA